MPQKENPSIKTAWKQAWNNKPARLKMLTGTVIMFGIITCLPIFFRHIEKRQGTVLHDWVLAQIPPHNVSVAIFIIIWGMSLLILSRVLYKPNIYVVYVWALIFVTITRLATISLVVLNPPIGLIPLADPLTGIFYAQAIITKDLFFSGHIATVTLTFLCLERKNDKIIGFISIIAIAVLLLVQHIHYTIDILASPIVTYACYRLARYIMLRPSKKAVKKSI